MTLGDGRDSPHGRPHAQARRRARPRRPTSSPRPRASPRSPAWRRSRSSARRAPRTATGSASRWSSRTPRPTPPTTTIRITSASCRSGGFRRWGTSSRSTTKRRRDVGHLLGSAHFSEGGRMAIAVHSEKLRELVDENAEVEQVATGFTFTEGPIWHPDGYLLFSDMPGDVRRKYTPGQGVEEVMRPSFKCNGMTLDANLDLIVCEHVTSALVAREARRLARAARLPLRGQVPEQPERRLRALATGRSTSPTRGTGASPASASSASGSWAGRASSGSRPAAARTTSSCVVDKNEFEHAERRSASRRTSRCSTSTTRRGPTSRCTT